MLKSSGVHWEPPPAAAEASAVAGVELAVVTVITDADADVDVDSADGTQRVIFDDGTFLDVEHVRPLRAPRAHARTHKHTHARAHTHTLNNKHFLIP